VVQTPSVTRRTQQPVSLSAGLSVRPGRAGGGGTAQPSAYARAVLDAVDEVPAGCVVTYGDVAELTGQGSARTVGMVMSRYGSEVPWWRVVQASGQPAAPYVQDALERLRAEGCPLRGDRVDLTRGRWAGPART
jgi:alkylated DNA nucleotide flippase Atl1